MSVKVRVRTCNNHSKTHVCIENIGRCTGTVRKNTAKKNKGCKNKNKKCNLGQFRRLNKVEKFAISYAEWFTSFEDNYWKLFEILYTLFLPPPRAADVHLPLLWTLGLNEKLKVKLAGIDCLSGPSNEQSFIDQNIIIL